MRWMSENWLGVISFGCYLTLISMLSLWLLWLWFSLMIDVAIKRFFVVLREYVEEYEEGDVEDDK